MQFLKADTVATLKIGPFLDSTDGNTAETGLTIAQADVRLSKNGGDIAQKTESTSCTHDELGIYGCPIDATDTNTEGRLQLWVHEAGALPVFHEFMVVNANVFDSLFAAATTDYLQVDAIQISGDATSANNLELDYDGTGYAGGTIVKQADVTKIGGVAQSATDLKDLADTGYDPSTHKVQGVVLTDTTTTNTDLVTAAVNADAVWDEVKSGHTGATTFGDLATDLDSVLTDTAVIGALGAGLTDLGGMSTGMKAEVESEANDALVALNLDHLCKTVTAAADMTTEVVDNTILSRVLANGDTSAYVPSTDSLQTIRDNLGGGDGSGFTAIPWAAAWDAEVQSECNDALVALKLDHLVAVAESDDPVDDSIIAKIAASDGDWSGFSASTDALEALYDALGPGVGAGARQFTYTVKDQDAVAMPDCLVQASTDAAKTNVVAEGYTNASGQVVFNLDDDTYYFWRRKYGYTFTDPDIETVSA